jgi:oxygen-independent coproporphyrinogen-3 oxidase
MRELAARAGSFAGRLVSIYVGGGTPSLWQPDCIARAIDAIAKCFGAEKDGLEITIEANPTDCDDAHLAAWRAAGINRISIGVQSLAQDELVVLGRDHRFGDGRAAVEHVKAAGGFTVSCDFILGVPPRRQPAFITDVDHLSVYELTIEDRTAFGQRVKAGRFTPLDEDALTELYIETHEQLTAAGFEHYEISSYARPGRRAVHNSLYWRGAPFLGLGVGAASLAVRADGSGERATNPRRAAAYMAAPGVPAERVAISPREMAVDRAWLGMRTSDGVTEAALPTEIVRFLLDGGLAERRADRICPTLRGFLMADRIAAQIALAL